MERLLRSSVLIGLALVAGCDSNAVGPDTANLARLYITSGATDEVVLLNAADGSILKRISTERRRDEVDEPHGIAVSPDGRHWYLTLAHGEPTLWKFEIPGDRLVGRVELGTYGAARIGITPDGRRAFIPDYYRSGQGLPSALAVVELGDLSVVATPTVCAAPHDAQVDPSGRRVAIACSLSDEVVILDVATLDLITRFFVDSQPGPPGAPRFKPLNLLWSPGGDVLYVGLFAAGAIAAFDAQGSLVGSVSVGAGPAQLALSRDGRTLASANRNDASISLIDLPTMSERTRVPLGRPHPHGITFDSTDRIAFVTYEGDTAQSGGVVAVDASRGEIVWAAEAGAFTLGVVYLPAN